MPPQRGKILPEDSKADTGSNREKYAGSFPSNPIPKNRRNVVSTANTAGSLKESVGPNQPASSHAAGTEDAPRV